MVSTFNFLGITIYAHLSWKPHIDKICTKLNRSLGVLRRLSCFLPSFTLKTLYNSLFLPYLQYGILLWGNSTTATRLNGIQKKALRAVYKTKYLAHCDPLFKENELLKFADLYFLNVLKFYYKLKNESLPYYFTDWFTKLPSTRTYSIRARHTLFQPKPTHKFLEKSLRYTTPNIISNVPAIILDKILTHSPRGFTNYVKHSCLKKYSITCIINNCFVCTGLCP